MADKKRGAAADSAVEQNGAVDSAAEQNGAADSAVDSAAEQKGAADSAVDSAAEQKGAADSAMEKAADKKRGAAADYCGESITEYIKKKKPDVCALIDKIIKELGSEERLAAAPINQLSAALGALIDRFGADEKSSHDADGALSSIFEDFKDVK